MRGARVLGLAGGGVSWGEEEVGGGQMARGRCSPAYSSLAQLGGDLRGEAAGFNLSSGSPGPGTMHTWGAAPKASSSAGLGWGVRTFNKLLMLLAGRSGAPHRTTGQQLNTIMVRSLEVYRGPCCGGRG